MGALRQINTSHWRIGFALIAFFIFMIQVRTVDVEWDLFLALGATIIHVIPSTVVAFEYGQAAGQYQNRSLG